MIQHYESYNCTYSSMLFIHERESSIKARRLIVSFLIISYLHGIQKRISFAIIIYKFE